MELIITKDNFEEEVLRSEKPVLIDFFATWCGPCRLIAPVIEELAAERTDIKVGKLDVDAEGELALRFHVMSIPTLVIMKDGKEVSRMVGLRNKVQLLDAIASALETNA